MLSYALIFLTALSGLLHGLMMVTTSLMLRDDATPSQPKNNTLRLSQQLRTHPMQNDKHADEAAIIPEILLAMRDAEIPPEFIYAYKKTGIIVLSEFSEQTLPAGALEKWEKAIREYFALEDHAETKPT